MSALAPRRSDVLSSLAAAESEIFGLGVQRLALFGSVKRDTAQPDSDVDFLVEFFPGAKSFDRLMALGDLLERVIGHDVELVTPESLSPYLKRFILADAVDVVRAA